MKADDRYPVTQDVHKAVETERSKHKPIILSVFQLQSCSIVFTFSNFQQTSTAATHPLRLALASATGPPAEAQLHEPIQRVHQDWKANLSVTDLAVVLCELDTPTIDRLR